MEVCDKLVKSQACQNEQFTDKYKESHPHGGTMRTIRYSCQYNFIFKFFYQTPNCGQGHYLDEIKYYTNTQMIHSIAKQIYKYNE